MNKANKQRDREKIVISNADDYEQFRWGSNFTEVDVSMVGEWRHGVLKEVIMKRESDNRLFCLPYAVGPDGTGFWDNNFAPLEATEVFPVEKTIIVYE